MKMPVFAIICIIPCILLSDKLLSQSDQTDSTFLQEAVNNAVAVYRQSERDQARVFNGRQYKPYNFPFVKGHPFFSSNEAMKASIVYDGGFYDNVKLQYDEISEMIIFDMGVKLELVNELTEQFTMGEHNFIRLYKDSTNHLPATGFYERLYNGAIKVYKKEKKSIKDVLSTSEGYQAEALDKQYYYLQKDSVYYPVSKKREMLAVLRNKKNEIQQFIKTNKLNYKRNTELTLTRIAAYYDQLTR